MNESLGMEKNETTNGFILRLVYLSMAGVLMVSIMYAIYKPQGGVTTVKPQQAKVILGNTEISITIADTPDTRAQGLSGRKQLGSNEGMFFVFQTAKPYGFWMKEMLFPIDMIWFDSQYHIIFVKEDAEPSSYPEIFTPNASAQYVLEVPAGFFSSHHLKFGDVLKIER